MALPVYIAVALLFPVVLASASAYEDIVPIPSHAYDSSVERALDEKRFPEHFNNAPPAWFWFNVGECPETQDGVKQFYCASLSPDGKNVCIDDHQLCNGVKECPNAEDENPKNCLFFKAIQANVRSLERDVQNLLHSYMRTPARRYSHGIPRPQYR